jgi:hypothetical protein
MTCFAVKADRRASVVAMRVGHSEAVVAIMFPWRTWRSEGMARMIDVASSDLAARCSATIQHISSLCMLCSSELARVDPATAAVVPGFLCSPKESLRRKDPEEGWRGMHVKSGNLQPPRPRFDALIRARGTDDARAWTMAPRRRGADAPCQAGRKERVGVDEADKALVNVRGSPSRTRNEYERDGF